MRVHINQSYRVLVVKTLNRKHPASLHPRAVTHLTPSETCTHALHLQCSACFVTEGSRTPRSARSRLSLTHPTACLMPRTPVPTPCVVCIMFSGRRAPLCLKACLVSRPSLHLCFAFHASQNATHPCAGPRVRSQHTPCTRASHTPCFRVPAHHCTLPRA